MDLPTKYCPRCGDEFQPHMEICPDCEEALVHEPPPAAGGAGAETLPPAEELTCVAHGDPWDVRSLAEVLQDEGVTCRIDRYPPSSRGEGDDPGRRIGGFGRGVRLGVYVRPEDAPHAAARHQERLRATLGEDGADASAPDPGAADAEAGCPACGTVADAAAEECPECGLHFPPAE